MWYNKIMVKFNKQNKKPLIGLIAAFIAIAALITAIVFIIYNNSSHCHGIIGVWKLQNDTVEGDYIFTFNNNGTGTDDQNGTIFNVSFVDHESSIELSYPENEISLSYFYQISKDNNTLTIQDINGNDVFYACQ